MKKFAGLAAVLALVATPILASPFEVQLDSNVNTAQDRLACAADAALPWCNTDVVETKAWSVADVVAVQDALVARFSYSYAPTLQWQSSYAVASQGVVWKDDCNGLTFTVLDALARKGFPKDKMFRAVVNPSGNASSVVHMVGIVEIEGTYWVVGDSNSPKPYQLTKKSFKPVLLSKVSDGRSWKRAVLNSRISVRAE